MRYVICCVVLACASMLALTTGGETDAGRFFLRRKCPPGTTCIPNQPTPPPVIGPLPGFKPEATPAQQPWLLISQTDDSSLPPPDTVLEPVLGTGSRLPIGGKIPDKITHILDAGTLSALKEALKGSSLQPGQVPITLPVDPSTSDRFSRILMLLEVLAWLGTGIFGGSAVGKLLPLVARLAGGLQSAIPAPSPVPTPTPVATSSTPPSK